LDVYWNILAMHVPINVKSPNNISKWQMGFNLVFKELKVNLNFGIRKNSSGEIGTAWGSVVVVKKLAMYHPRFWLLFCTAACTYNKSLTGRPT
jgi:hypothetical protein